MKGDEELVGAPDDEVVDSALGSSARRNWAAVFPIRDGSSRMDNGESGVRLRLWSPRLVLEVPIVSELNRSMKRMMSSVDLVAWLSWEMSRCGSMDVWHYLSAAGQVTVPSTAERKGRIEVSMPSVSRNCRRPQTLRVQG